MECRSDSFRCEGLTRFAGGGSVGFEGALEVLGTGVDGCETPCVEMEGRLVSVGTVWGCETGRRSLIV
jgi:hypothetical protein